MVNERRSVLITGGGRGLGAAIAKKFIFDGFNVIIIGRNRDVLESFIEDNGKNIEPNQTIDCFVCDVSKEEEIDELLLSLKANELKIDILINNASVFGPIGSLEDVAWSDWKDTFQTNLFGTVYLCKKFVGQLKTSARGKIINISGGGASVPYPSLCAYATSKTAIIRFSEEFAEEMKVHNIDVNSVAPGPMNTRFISQALEAGEKALGKPLFNAIKKIRETGGTPFELAAELCSFLASRSSDGITGKQISARFDDWATWVDKIEELNKSQIYTLRRVDKSLLETLENSFRNHDASH